MDAIERTFVLRSGLRMSARIHHSGAGCRILAVHGWLDNAASFDAIAAELPECEIVAIDLPGHGRSEHRPAGAWHALPDDLDVIVQVLDQLHWQRSIWLGHSLGGALLSMLAAATPDRVAQLVLIESVGPLAGDAAGASERLRRGLDDRLAFDPARARRLFADPEEAVDARRKANGMSEKAARALVERGLCAVEGGWRWSTDPRLLLASPVRMDETHVSALLAAIACPVMLLLADPPLPFLPAAIRDRRLALLSYAERHSFSGHHHLHMETPEPLADRLRAFVSRPDSPARPAINS